MPKNKEDAIILCEVLTALDGVQALIISRLENSAPEILRSVEKRLESLRRPLSKDESSA